MEIKRGDVIIVDLEPVIGSEQGKMRPCVVVQNDVGNKHAPTTVVAPITDAEGRKAYPFQVFLDKGEANLGKDSIIMCEQIRVIDKERIIKITGNLSEDKIKELNSALICELDL
jgi:mRNA interferase MazF